MFNLSLLIKLFIIGILTIVKVSLNFAQCHDGLSLKSADNSNRHAYRILRINRFHQPAYYIVMSQSRVSFSFGLKYNEKEDQIGSIFSSLLIALCLEKLAETRGTFSWDIF